MDALNKLLQDLGISKVKLAKYLGVSRQMVYNYLTFEDINNWPKEKKALLFQLLEIDSSSFKGFDKIKVTTEYMLRIEKKLNSNFSANVAKEKLKDEVSKVLKEIDVLYSKKNNKYVIDWCNDAVNSIKSYFSYKNTINISGQSGKKEKSIVEF